MPVPVLKEEFEYDNPILGSTAEPADSEYGRSLCEVNIVSRKYGQQLFGNMIPMRAKDMLRKLAEKRRSSGVIADALDNSFNALENFGASMTSFRSLGAISEGTGEDIEIV